MWRLQGFDSKEFVKRYWQKKPCLLRGAFADFESPVSPEELAGLACEEEVHCRLVIENDDGRDWQLRYGPFEESDFTGLPQSGYSLLVSECEKWLPGLGGLLEQFNFVPDWRVDDLMLSYAPPGGSVGPHVDEYDVFLLQATGKRRWLYRESRIDKPRLIPGLDLAILADFQAERDEVLEPGDMLYLPPGCAHHGIALDRCMTYSIGFRAPDAIATLESLAHEIEDSGAGLPRYRDPELELDRHRAEITDREIERFRRLASDFLDQPAQTWCDAVGKMLSDSALAQAGADEQPVYLSDLQTGDWMRHPETRLYFHETAGGLNVYCNGCKHELPVGDEIRLLLQQLCENKEWPTALLNRCIDVEPLQSLLLALASTQAIIPLDC